MATDSIIYAAADNAASALRVACTHCREMIHADALRCPFCQISQPRALEIEQQHARTSRRKIATTVGLLVGLPIVVIVALFLYGASLGPGSFNGTNYKLYQTMAIWSTGLTPEQADIKVDEIAAAANVSHNDAERMAIGLTRNRIDPSLWITASTTAAKIDKLKQDGVLP
jgi:hypothetical protein